MPVAHRRIIRDRNAKPCAVVRRAVQRVNVAWSSALTTSFAFGRPVINTPIHASMPEPHATSNLRDRTLVNFTWWVNRLDADGSDLFEGGFLGLDNIGPLDRSHLPVGGTLQQSDSTGWMAFYALVM